MTIQLTPSICKRIYERWRREQPHHYQLEPWIDYTTTPDYQEFVNECTKHCQCSHDCPCDGVMAGGICDNLQWSNDEPYES